MTVENPIVCIFMYLYIMLIYYAMYLAKTYLKNQKEILIKIIRYPIIFLSPHWIILNTPERSLLWPVAIVGGC